MLIDMSDDLEEFPGGWGAGSKPEAAWDGGGWRAGKGTLAEQHDGSMNPEKLETCWGPHGRLTRARGWWGRKGQSEPDFRGSERLGSPGFSVEGILKVQQEAESFPRGPFLPQPDLDNIRISFELGGSAFVQYFSFPAPLTIATGFPVPRTAAALSPPASLDPGEQPSSGLCRQTPPRAKEHMVLEMSRTEGNKAFQPP